MLPNRLGQWSRLRLIFRRSQHTRRPYSNSVEPPPKSKFSSTSSATSPSSTSSPGASTTADQTASRFSRLHDRLPRFLQRYTTALRLAPVSHITAFLILHEITAIIPVVGLGWYFYRAEKLPWFAQGAWFDEGVRKFGRYFRKKGWLGTADSDRLAEVEIEETKNNDRRQAADNEPWWRRSHGEKSATTKREKWWGRSEGGVRLVTSVAAAYALTKALLPLRLILSVWMTPMFARTTVVPITRRIKNLFTKKK